MFPTVGSLDQDGTPREGMTIRHRCLTASRSGRRLSSATPDQWCPRRAAARSRRAPPDWHTRRCLARSRTASRTEKPGPNRVRRNPRTRQAECLVRGHRRGCARITVGGSPNRKRSPTSIQRPPFREAIPRVRLCITGRPEHAGIVLVRWRGGPDGAPPGAPWPADPRPSRRSGGGALHVKALLPVARPTPDGSVGSIVKSRGRGESTCGRLNQARSHGPRSGPASQPRHCLGLRVRILENSEISGISRAFGCRYVRCR